MWKQLVVVKLKSINRKIESNTSTPCSFDKAVSNWFYNLLTVQWRNQGSNTQITKEIIIKAGKNNYLNIREVALMMNDDGEPSGWGEGDVCMKKSSYNMIDIPFLNHYDPKFNEH